MSANLPKDFDDIFKKVRKPDFLNMSTIGNEVPFYISTFDPAQLYAVDEQIELLTTRLEEDGIKVCNIRLYDLCVKILDEKDALELIAEREPELDSEEMLDALRMLLDIDDVVAEIGQQILDAGAQLTFVRQVGQVFPYIRSHALLNNLQAFAKTCPTVFFFPGLYDNVRLKLFNLLDNDNYYRALNLASLPV